jgi:sulfite reductase (ferredoxin)
MELMNCFSLKQKYCCSKYKKENLVFYQELAKLDFVTLGYDTIISPLVPGTDTCNLELQVALELLRN